MTKAAIFSLLPVRPNSTVASTRIGVWLRDLLGVDLFDGPEIAEQGDLDVLFIINGSTLFCKCLPEIADAVRRAKRVVWIQNDYTLPPPKPVSDAQSPFRKVFADRGLVPDYWTTCRENRNLTAHSAEVNWNCLGMDYTYQRPVGHDMSDSSWFYYGAYRENREASFKFLNEVLPKVYVSSTSKKFDAYSHFERHDPMSRTEFYGELARHGLGIYIQDAKSAPRAHSPATRFYEMLTVGLPMVFTADCVPTLAQYGYDVAPYVLTRDNAEILQDNRFGIARTQRFMWHKDYVNELAIYVKSLAREIL